MANHIPPGTNKARVSLAEKEKRIAEAAKLLLRGYNRYQLIEFFGEKYGYTQSTTSEYYTQALEFIREVNKEEIRTEVHYEIQRLEDLYKECMDIGDRSNAAKVAKMLQDLKGFQQSTKIELDNENNSGKVNITIVSPK